MYGYVLIYVDGIFHKKTHDNSVYEQVNVLGTRKYEVREIRFVGDKEGKKIKGKEFLR